MVCDEGRNNKIIVSNSRGKFIDVFIRGDENTCQIGDFPIAKKLDVKIEGSNCVLVIDNLRRIGNLRILLKNKGSISIGPDSSFEDCYILADGAAVAIGRDCMVSFQVSIRTTDAHGIYDVRSGELLNPPGSIRFQDHVWIGQGTIIGRGAEIGRNAVIGARSYVQKQCIAEGCLVAGSPARLLREGIVWDRKMTHNIYNDGASVDALFFEHIREKF